MTLSCINASFVAKAPRRTTFGGREYIVAPMTLIVPGVLRGSEGPLYYPPEQVARNYSDWNHVPIVVYHPTGSVGEVVSARNPQVLERQGVGFLFNSYIGQGGKLRAEGWFDVQKTRQVDGRVLGALEKGARMEISTGLTLESVPAPAGSVHNSPGGSRPYVAVAQNYHPDHLAILPDVKGACSVADGCGLHVNAQGLALDDVLGIPAVMPDSPAGQLSSYFQGLVLISNAFNSKQLRVAGGSSRDESSVAPQAPVPSCFYDLVLLTSNSLTEVGNAKAKLEGGRWVTMQGQHVYIKGGKVIAGPSHLMGKKPPPEGAQGAHEKEGSHKVGGRITVTSGPHAGKSGTVLAAYKSQPKVFVKFDKGGRHHLSHAEVAHEGATDGGRGKGSGGAGAQGTAAKPGEPVAGETGRSGGTKADQGRGAEGQSASRGTAERLPVSLEEADAKIGRFSDFFRSRGEHHVADWLDKVRDHVSALGPAAALEALGPAAAGKTTKHDEAQYWGVGTEEKNWKNMGDWMEKYLARNGVTAVTGEHSSPESPLISALGKPDRYVAGRDFKTEGGVYKDKLDEAKHLPGLEKSRDVSEVVGKPVTHLTREVTDKLDKEYGKGQWIVKCYDDNAAAGYGIFFPQRAASVVQTARTDIWESGQKLAQYGFEHVRDESGKVVGIKHKDGKVYHFDDALTAIRSSPDIGGNEHEVHEDSQNNRFFKITKEGDFGYSRSLREYLTRHQLANEMWPELGYSFHGITEDHQGRPRAVMSMNRIEGEHPSNHEINHWFGDRGFEPVFEHDKGWRKWDPEEGYYVEQWRDPKTGTVFADASSQNFIKTARGGLVPIDLDIKPGKGYYGPGKISDAASVGGGPGGGQGGTGKVPGHDTGTTAGVHPPQSGPTPLRPGISPTEALKVLGGVGVAQVIATAKAAGYHIEPSSYERTIHGEVRAAGDVARDAAGHEKGAMLPPGSFMVQPAFPAVGISDADRAAGRTWHGTNEGRVHLVTRENGDVEVIPHATWLKGGQMPVVFEDNQTRAMAQAAIDTVRSLPASARKGQVYAPDVMKTGDGFKVVELNAQGDHNGSGYLHDNHFTIDAYTSHLTGRDPLHVSFIRNLLTKRAPGSAGASSVGRAAVTSTTKSADEAASTGRTSGARFVSQKGDRVKITGGEHAGKTATVIAAYRKLPKVFLRLEGGGKIHIAHEHLARSGHVKNIAGATAVAARTNLRDAVREVAANAGGNCGIGPGGFQPGNKCAAGGGKSPGGRHAVGDEVHGYSAMGYHYGLGVVTADTGGGYKIKFSSGSEYEFKDVNVKAKEAHKDPKEEGEIPSRTLKVKDGKVEGTNFTPAQLNSAALKAGKEMFGDALVLSKATRFEQVKLSDLHKAGEAGGYLDEYEYVFKPSTGKGLDVAGEPWKTAKKDWADKDGHIYAVWEDTIRQIVPDVPLKGGKTNVAPGGKISVKTRDAEARRRRGTQNTSPIDLRDAVLEITGRRK